MKKFLTVLLIIISGSCVFAEENLQKFNLENGQTVIIKEVKSNPIVTIDTWIKTGSINENDSNNGVSHFLEHLFFKGSENHAPGEFDKLLEAKGAVTNAATSKDFTHYYITIPSKHFDEALNLHADMLLNPLIPRKELEKERKVVLEEIAKDENSPNRVVYENLISMMYTTHPYKRKVIGTKNIIETIHRDEILNYYKKWYSPVNMVTVIVGDVDANDVLNKVRQNFACESKKPVKSVYAKEMPLNVQQRKTEYLETQTGYMLIGFRGANINETDTYVLDVLSVILGEGRSSVFYKNLKDRLQLANTISALNAGFRDDGIFYISASFDPEKQQRLEDEIFSQIKNIQENGVTDEQVNLAKNVLERETCYARESVSNIAEEIGYVMVTSGDIGVYENYIDNIKKVTPQDIKRAANKYLGVNKSAVSIILPETSKEVKISNTAQTVEKPVLISSANGTEEYLLQNGATLLLTPNTANKIVAISIFAKGGHFLENKYGIANLTAASMLKGTKKYTSQELAEILEDNGIKIIPESRSDALSVTVLTTAQQYEKTLELLSETINNATFTEYELEKVKNDKLKAIKKSRDIPLNVALEEYKHLIFDGTPYSNSTYTLEKNIPQISREDIVDYYQTIFAPQNIVISVNGDVDKDKTFEAFSVMFNSKSKEKFDYSVHKEEITQASGAVAIEKQIPSTNTDWIFLAWQTAGLDNKKDYAALQVIDSLLGTGMSSRLFKNLRDQEGLAYQLGSGYSANILKGAFVVYIGTNPETFEKSLDGLWNEINKLKTEFVGTKELREAKDKLIGQFLIALETNLDKAVTTGWFETAGAGYKFLNEYEELINSVTETDIMRAANEYFNDKYVLATVKNK